MRSSPETALRSASRASLDALAVMKRTNSVAVSCIKSLASGSTFAPEHSVSSFRGYPVDAGQRQQKVLRDTDTGI